MNKIKPESRKLVRSFQYGIGGIVVIGILVFLTFSAQYGLPLYPKTYVKAAFADVDQLALKDPVRQNSKGIGRVYDIAYENGQAIVTLQVELGSDYAVYKNATAKVQDQSAVGSKFVELNPGSPDAGPLGGEVIPQEQTTSSRDVYQVLSIFDQPTRTATQGFLQQFGGGLAGQAQNFSDFLNKAPDTLNDLGAVSAALASPEADLPSLLNAADRLSSRFQGREQEIASLINQTESTFSAIAVDNGAALANTLQRAPAALDEVRTAMDSLNEPFAETRAAMTDLESAGRSLGDAEDSTRGMLRDGVPVLYDVDGVADQAVPAIEDLTPAFADARPLAPMAAEAITKFSTPLQAMAPYGKEFGYLFVRGNSFLSEGTADGVHYARLNADFQGLYSFTGGVLKACNFNTNPYPKPGEADNDRTDLVESGAGQIPCGAQTQTPLGGIPR